MKIPAGFKLAALVVAGDLALAVLIVGMYSVLSRSPQASKRAEFKTEVTKAEEEATKHTGR